MASEDVIELGSSDEETEPAPKRVKMPNAMVHIPSKLPGLTIKTTNSKKKLNPLKKLIGNAVTVTKIKPGIDNRNQNNIHTISDPRPINPIVNTSINPVRTTRLHVVKPPSSKLAQPLKLPINLVSSFANNLNIPQAQLHKIQTKPSKVLKNPVKINNVAISPLNVSNFPSSSIPRITNIVSMSKKRPIIKITPKRTETLMVEGDDEGTSASSTANPVWYLRPEETTRKDMEQENNAESEDSNMIEITIEDSPGKPGNKRTDEVGTELAITIDDSPVKTPTKSHAFADARTKKRAKDDYHCKKKLDYQEDTIGNTIEIELEPLFPHSVDVEIPPKENSLNIDEDKSAKQKDDIIEVVESPAKIIKSNPTTPKKTSQSCKVGETSSVVQEPQNKMSEDFHPVYNEFIELCLKVENSSDMKTIVDKKIKSYYKQVSVDYVESEDFIDMVQSKIHAIKSDPEKLYLYIKDVVDELNLQRKMAKAYPPPKETKDIEAEKFQYGENSEFDSKRQRQIRKLEKTLKKLHRAIQKLEEQEVDFDDDEDSVYLLTERYKERMVRVHAKFCQLTNTKLPSEPRVQIDPRPGQPAGPAKRLEKWVNKKVPIGKPLPFPDFHDVLRCVREANEEDKLGWNEADIIEEARDLFTRCGKKLQRRRQENEWRLAASRIALTRDPAEESDELKKKLEANLQLASKKETDIFNKYADKQNLLNLEAVEIGDKEADESPVESEDEVLEEGTSMEDKEKRKERLRRLINEKSNKKVDEVSEPKESLKADNNESQNVDAKVSNETENGDKNAQDDVIESDKVTKDGAPESEGSKAETQLEKENNSVDSDVDELHLLQKLHSDEVISSNEDTSDNDSPIDFSDNIHTSSEKGKQDSDVISIEDSSYSDSDRENVENKNDVMEVEIKEVCVSDAATITDNAAIENVTRTSDVDMESVLLPSSDDESGSNKSNSPKTTNECINLNDDSISIGDTVIQEIKTSENAHFCEIDSEEKNNIEISSENAAKKSKIVKVSPSGPKANVENAASSEIPDVLNNDLEALSAGDTSTCGIAASIETTSNDVASEIAVELNKDEVVSSVGVDNATDVSKDIETIENGIDQKNRNTIERNAETPVADNTEQKYSNQKAIKDSTSDSEKSVEKTSDVIVDKSDTHGEVDKSESLDNMLEELRSDLGMNGLS